MATLVVGDVHGCADELDRLVREVQPERVVLVGDLFTKGPDPAGVWAQIVEGGWTAVLGNHDERLLKIVDGLRPRDEEGAGTVAALNRSDPVAGRDPSDQARFPALEPGWLAWLRALPLFLEVEGFTVVHAGLHPSGALKATTRQMALCMRRWPDDRDPANPFWYQVYQGARRVIFGHDAVRGLVRVERDGAPWVIGLDTGCVYGGKLSGYLPTEDRVVQVPARRAYCPISRSQPDASSTPGR